MRLRHHPLLSFRGKPNWPPHWTEILGATPGKKLKGEIGVLREAQLSAVDDNRCFLTMEDGGRKYIACLWFDNQESCQRIHDLLQRHVGEPITKIGAIDLPVGCDRLGIP